MKNDTIDLPLEIYLEHLQTIKNIEFTPREIDVLACVVSGRSTRTIPAFLSIAARTVASHMSRIKLKTGCASQENVIDFIKGSDKIPIIKSQYYPSLLTQITFEKYLKQIPRAGSAQRPLCLLIYSREQKNKHIFLSYIEGHLKLAGFNVETSIKEDYKDSIELQEKITSRSANYILYIVPKILIAFDQKEETFKDKFIFLFLDKEILSETSKELSNISCVNFSIAKDYYFSFFEILKKIKTDYNFDNVISEFTQSCGENHTSSETIPLESPLETKEKAKDQKANVFFNMLRGRFKIFALGLLSLGIIGALLFSNGWNLMDSNTKPIITNMPTLTNSAFLIRPELMMRLDNIFKGRGGIQVVALIGIGGIGKTTTARQYARQQQSQVIWEINAETEESLKSSFEKLALHLDKTEEDKKILREIREIKNPAEKEEKIVLFVQEHLKSQSNWFLLYDNAKKFSDIQKYFPQDSKLWGAGKIIITTQNTNIENNTQVSHVISIEELSAEQKFNLFSKIMGHGSIQPFTVAEEAETLKFLENIPPFPLDVAVAAYYLKTINISYKKYLENLETYTDEFNNVQKNLLNEAGPYIKTRYAIITQSLEYLIKNHKDFGALLLFISLLDSQNIPRELLSHHYSDAVADNFMYHLKKYSLITDNFSISGKDPTFSVHRSTQAIALAYLIKKLNLEKNNEKLILISDKLINYAVSAIEEDNFPKLEQLITHYQTFLTHKSLLSFDGEAAIKCMLGSIYCCLYDIVKSKNLIEDNFSELNKQYGVTAQALTCLGILERELGNYEKAKKLLKQSVSLYKSHLSEHNASFARTVMYLGDVYRLLEDTENAKIFLEKGVALYKNFPENQLGMARALKYLALVYRMSGSYEKSKGLLEQSLTTYRKKYSDHHIGVAQILAHLGNVYKNLGDDKKAKNYLEESLTVFKKLFSANHLKIAWASLHLGDAYGCLGQYVKARNILKESLTIYRKHYPEDNDWIVKATLKLGKIEQELGNKKAASDLFESGLKTHKKNYSKDKLKKIRYLTQLGDFYSGLGNYEEAKTTYHQCMEIYANKRDEIAPRASSETLLKLADSYKNLGDYDLAENVLNKVLLIYEKYYGNTYFKVDCVFMHLGIISLLKNNLELAQTQLTQALKLFQKNGHPDIYKVLENLSDLYQKKAEYAEKQFQTSETQIFKAQAVDYLRQALEVVKTHFPSDSPHMERIQLKLQDARG